VGYDKLLLHERFALILLAICFVCVCVLYPVHRFMSPCCLYELALQLLYQHNNSKNLNGIIITIIITISHHEDMAKGNETWETAA
jgi:hypothetical protein